MAGISPKTLEPAIESLRAKVAQLKPRAASCADAIERWRGDASATLFHLRRGGQLPLLTCILGGTGTGKSTLVNRLLEANLSAASFRRTFTAGCVAIAAGENSVPVDWLAVPHAVASEAELPARGALDSLAVVQAHNPLLEHVVLVDTPDLDGDQPAHHAQADRAFRWAQAILFLVSPEKYQMTELLPYYRLARRYGLATLFVMNKCESSQMLEDYRKLIDADSMEPATLFAVARDDAAYEPPPEANLSALRQAVLALAPAAEDRRLDGIGVRTTDLLSRMRDQITAPLRVQRRDADMAISSLRAMETPAPGVDVNPITEALQRRLQQRSVLYLIGPGRVLDRIRQVPGLLVRLPRNAWDLFLHGKTTLKTSPLQPALDSEDQLPNFNATLSDQFTVVQSRIDDVLRAVPSGAGWLSEASGKYAESRLNPAEAGKIADEELADLDNWIQKRWNATPRDTVLLLKLLKYLPGGEKLTQSTEAAPYLLAIVIAAHHALFGHVDLMVLGGYSLATWITERLSNEVASRTRATNRAIASRFERLAHEQIRRTIAWIDARAPRKNEIDAIDSLANSLEETLAKD